MKPIHVCFSRIQRAERSDMNRAMEDTGLSPAEVQALRYITFHKAMSQRELAEDMGIDKGATSRLVDVLEEKGDAIFAGADSVVLEVDLDKPIVKKVVELAARHRIPLYGLVSNMSIAAERRDLLQQFDCVICNQQEAGILFLDEYDDKSPEEMRDILADRIAAANIPSMVVTMGAEGAVYANLAGEKGICPARKVQVKDTTGAGDIFGGSAVWKLLQLGKKPEELNKAELTDVVRFACTAAGLSTTQSGGISSVPEYADVLKAM